MPESSNGRSLAVCIALLASSVWSGAFAQSSPPTPAGQAVLPYAEQKYRGNVGTSYLNSDPAQFPVPRKAPAGAPNVLLVLLDDVGFGQFSVSGGGVPSPTTAAPAIDALPCENMTFLMTEQKRPFTANGFGNWMRDRCDEAGLPDCSSHGLRKAMPRDSRKRDARTRRLPRNGHTTDAQVNLSTKAACQNLLSDKAMQALQESEQGTKPATPKPAISKSGS